MLIGQIGIRPDGIEIMEQDVDLLYGVRVRQDYNKPLEEMFGEDLTELENIYENVGVIKAEGHFVFGTEQIGVRADSNIMSLAAQHGISLQTNHIETVDGGEDVILMGDDVVVVIEDADENADEFTFYMIGRTD